MRTPIIAAALAVVFSPALAQDESLPPPQFPTTLFNDDATTTASVTAEGVTATVTMVPPADADSGTLPVLSVEVNGTKVAEATGAETDFNVPTASASIAKMNAGDAFPSVYFASYSGGAHCCNTVIVAQENKGEWVVVPIGDFDGDGDYLDDLDGDGLAEIVTVDNRFLYQFDSYAASAAPLVIYTVREGNVVDITREPKFLSAHRAWLAQMESYLEPEDRWSSPGFLAGWVAGKSLLGQGAEAWQALNANWDADSDEGQEVCASGGELESCEAGNIKVMKFPERLQLFLAEAGYTF